MPSIDLTAEELALVVKALRELSLRRQIDGLSANEAEAIVAKLQEAPGCRPDNPSEGIAPSIIGYVAGFTSPRPNRCTRSLNEL